MIAHLSGRLASKTPENIIVDVGGVGYEVHVPLSTFYILPDENQGVSLLVYTDVKEDSIRLFGFLTAKEKELFVKLITVSGIGPKLALNILSGIESDDLALAVNSGNIERICAIPGVGKKMAGRLILELKDKLKVDEQATDTAKDLIENKEMLFDDVVSALTNLGYKKNIVENNLSSLINKSENKNWTFENLLKASLKLLAK